MLSAPMDSEVAGRAGVLHMKPVEALVWAQRLHAGQAARHAEEVSRSDVVGVGEDVGVADEVLRALKDDIAL